MKFTTVLKQYINNEVTANELKESDEIIHEVKLLGTKLKSKIVIWFDDIEQYFNLFDLNDYDVRDAESILDNYGGGFEYFDSYSAEEDWKSGSIFNYFDERNINRLKEIFTYIGPQFIEYFDFENEDKNNIIADLLVKYDYDNVTGYIQDEYQTIMNDSMRDSLVKSIEYEYCDILEKLIIIRNGECFYNYITSVGVLNRLYERYGNNEDLTLVELLQKVTKEFSVSGEFYSQIWETWDGNFDSDGFNVYVNNKLEKYLEALIENFEASGDFPEIVNFLGNRFGFNEFFDVPGKPIMIKINSVNPEDNTINITINNKTKNVSKNYNPDLETFMSYLNNLDLFELGVE